MQFDLLFQEQPLNPVDKVDASETERVSLPGPLSGIRQDGSERPIKDGAALTEAAILLAARAGMPAQKVAAALRAIGYVDQMMALGEVIQILSLSQARIVALREMLPNLPQVLTSFELIGSLDASLCEPTTYQKVPGREYSPCNRTAEGNFLQWMFFHYPPKTALTALPHAHPLKLDVLVVWWVYGSAVRLFGDQIPAWRVEGLTNKTTAGTDIETLEFLITHNPNVEVIQAGAAKSGYPPWLEQLNAFNTRRNLPRLPEFPNLELPKAIQRLLKVREVDLKCLTGLEATHPSQPCPC